MEEKKLKIYSALKPTGDLTIGNYIGALKNMKDLTDKYECFYTVADLHALTVDNVPENLRRRTYDFAALFIAMGLNNENSTLFVQSHVAAHAELAWVLNCYTQFGEARRMTQFKDKSAKAPQNVNVGLFAYPTLMAADILLYQADLVPIGKDQQQHLELSRTIAERFNNRYSPTFTVPEGLYGKKGSKIYSLTNPTAKMGKTDDDHSGTVFLLDDADTISRKFKRAVTDSGSEVCFSKDKPGISNLLTIYSVMTGKSEKQTIADLGNLSYAALKERVADCIIESLRPMQAEYNKLIKDKAYLDSILKENAGNAARMAYRTLNKVYKKVGLVPRT